MFPFDLPENIRKLLVFSCFQEEEDQKGTSVRKGLMILHITGCCVVDFKKSSEELKKLVVFG